MDLICATDGAYSNSRDLGGVGVAFFKEGKLIAKFSKTYHNTTNNRCEILAVIHALKAISKPINSIIIYTDSQYVFGCITKDWQRKKNVDLWKLYDKYYEKASRLCSDIQFGWCKGHTGKDDFISKINDIADNLATNCYDQYEI